MSNYINLWDELNNILNENNKNLSDIKWIGIRGDKCFDTKQFLKVAKTFNYNCGFGTAILHEFLTVAGRYWWLERHEYDGSEWWEFKSLPPKPEGILKGKDEEVIEEIYDKFLGDKAKEDYVKIEN